MRLRHDVAGDFTPTSSPSTVTQRLGDFEGGQSVARVDSSAFPDRTGALQLARMHGCVQIVSLGDEEDFDDP